MSDLQLDDSRSAANGETDDIPNRDSSKRRRVTVEEVEDEEGGHGPWVCTEYPGLVAQSLGEAVTHFEDCRREQEALGQGVHAPFADDEEWGMAKWLMKRPTQTGIDEMCKLPIVSFSSESPADDFHDDLH